MKKEISIYKITNNITGGIYIGSTSTSLHQRLINHISRAKNNSSQKLHKAMREYGYENFSIEQLEKVSLLEQGEKEEYYIQAYQTNTDGNYNTQISCKRKSTKNPSVFLTPEEISLYKQIRSDLLDGTDIITLIQKYNIDKEIIRLINNGKYVFSSRIIYPIYKSKTYSNLTREEVDEIQQVLLNGDQDTNFSEIARKYNVSLTAINLINNGKSHHNFNYTYPLLNRTKCNYNDFSEKFLKEAAYYLSLGLEYKSICSLLDNKINRHTLANIDKGKSVYNKKLSNTSFPIKTKKLNKKENIELFNQLIKSKGQSEHLSKESD